MNVFQEIKLALIKAFKGKFPAYAVTCEDLTKTDEPGQEADLDNWIFIDLAPSGNSTATPFHTDRRVLVDVAIHTASEKNADYLEIMPDIDTLIRPVFRFGNRAITVHDLEMKVVDKVLHGIFTLEFRDSREEPEALPFMEVLGISIKSN